MTSVSISPTTRRVIRVIVGLMITAGLLTGAGTLGFMGLWTYTGYKVPGDPGTGTLLYAGAVVVFAAAGVALAWSVTTRHLKDLGLIALSSGAIALAFVTWMQSAA